MRETATPEMTITAAADGSALGNPGPAGWAWYVDDDTWAAGGWPHATNNQGELMAVLDLFRSTAHVDDDLHILCDSLYVIKSVTKWMPGWKKKGWRKGDGKPVLNLELVQQLDAALVGRRYRFEWVKGHIGHVMNEAADARARAAAEAFQRGTAVPNGPGYPGAARVGVPDAGPVLPVAASPTEPASLFTLDLPDLVTPDVPDRVTPDTGSDDLVLRLSPSEHARLRMRARAAGAAPEEFLRGLI